MRLKQALSISGLMASGLLFISWCSPAFGGYCRHCNPCPNGTSGDFFGYYPTNWRPWPAVPMAAVQEPLPAPATSPAPLPKAPLEPERKPKPVDKPNEQISFPSRLGQESRSDLQPYSPPPQ